jgi:ATP-dependent protease ClpP protease subunit
MTLLLSLIGGNALAASPATTPTFYLVGTIVEDSPRYLKEFFEEIPAEIPVDIVINSPGGSMNASIEIGNMIAKRKNVTCRVRRLAASGAFFALQSCAVRIIRPESMLLTHEPRTFILEPVQRDGLAQLWISMNKDSETWNALCSRRLKLTPAQYTEKVRGKDWAIEAKEAIAVGAADRIEAAK